VPQAGGNPAELGSPYWAGAFTEVSGLDGFAVGLQEFTRVYRAPLVPKSLKI